MWAASTQPGKDGDFEGNSFVPKQEIKVSFNQNKIGHLFNFFLPSFTELLLLNIQSKHTIYSSKDFLFISGTVASFDGYPTGSNASSFSLDGRPKSCRKAGPQFRGVDVSVTSPAVCIAVKNSPVNGYKFIYF